MEARRRGPWPWAWTVPLLATVPMVGLSGGLPDLGDSLYFAGIGRTLLSGSWAQTYATSGVQAGPLELVLYGAAGRLGGALGVGLGWLLAPVVEGGTVVLLLLVLGVALAGAHRRALVQGALGLVGVLTTAPYLVFAGGHPADAVIPLVWVLAANEARRGRPVRAGVLLGLSASVEAWGVLGTSVLLLLPSLRRAPRALAAELVLAVGPYLPFVVAGGFHMFAYRWAVASGTLVSLVLPAGSAFPWTLRLAQGGLALAAGAAVAWRARRSPRAVVGVPLAIVGVRLLLDPEAYGYYLAAWIVLAVAAAGLVASPLEGLVDRRRSRLPGGPVDANQRRAVAL